MRDYVSGEQSDLIDFCIPCNPYFPTPAMFERLQRNLETILKYYPSDADTITAELCNTLGLQPQTVAMGNGSTELITWIDHLLVRESLAVPIPTFGRWTDQPLETGKRVDMYPLLESQGFRLDVDSFVRFVRNRGSRVAVICNPNNPDGGFVARKDVVRMLDALHDLDLVVVDESFIDFVDAEPYRSVVEEAAIRPNVIVLKSLGKNFGLHGIRFGYMVANPALAGTIRKALPKWNLNSFAEVVVFMLKEYQEEYYNSLRLVARDRQLMYEQLSQLPGLTVYPSQGNFIMIKLPDGRDGVELRDFLLTQFGVYVRECGNKLGTTSQFLRLVVRPQPDVQRLLNGLFAFLYGMDTLKVPTAQAQQVSAGAQQQVGHGQKPSLTAGNPDAAWATGLAEITAPRQAAMAAMPGARPAGLSDPAVPAVASVGAQPLSAPVTTATGPLPQVTVSNVTEQNPLAVADTGVHAAITTGAGTAGAGAAAAGAAGADTGAFPVVQTGMIASVGAGGLASLTGGNAGSVAGGTAGTATLTPAVPGAGAPGGAGAGTTGVNPAAVPSTGSVLDTDARLPVVPTADITAPHPAITDTGPWPAVGGAGLPPAAQPPAAALTTQPVAQTTQPVGQTTQPVAQPPAQPAQPAAQPAAEPGPSAPDTDPAGAPSTTISKRPGEVNVTETGSWSIPPDLASARARANAERGGKPRPTVADINARSGYTALGIDDRFALPPASRDSGPGTDWISIRRRKN
ncbi:pyridoxal phosphate-dependent aminotransferase [Thermopolyspora flexuosa]|nr:histidinol-phosphate transaminase [Thermopolyspora flexuosa]